MLYEVELAYESLASGGAPGYEPYQWSLILTKAQLEFIKEIVGQGLYVDQYNSLVLSPITDTSEATYIGSYSIPNSYLVEFDCEIDSIYRILRETVNNDTKVVISPRDLDFIERNLDNPFKNPTNTNFWRILHNNNIIIVTEGTSINSYEFDYIKYPRPIVAPGTPTTVIDGFNYDSGLDTQWDCELHKAAHPEIINKAARIADNYIKDIQDWQMKSAEDNRLK